jgi:peptide/nickel transport system substrate-binding protein
MSWSAPSRRAFIQCAAALALGPALAGCIPVPRPSPLARGLIIGLGAEPAGLDPLQQTGLIEASVYANVFDPLLMLDRDGALQPALAESYRPLDSRTWEFRLRSGIRFHNGEPFDSASVRATVERMLDPAVKSPVRAQLASIERVETPDPGTAIVVTRQPFAPLLSELSALMMLPPQTLLQSDPDTLDQRPIGTGPFRFAEWLPGQRVVLTAEPSHWRGTPSVSRLEFRSIPEDSARLIALRAGELDLATGVPAQAVHEIASRGIRVVDRPGIQTLYLRLNARKPPLDDRRVRQALALAVNADEIITTLYGGRARRVNGPYPPEVFAYDSSAPPQAYDPQRARALLREAGLEPGAQLVLESPRGRYPADLEVAQALVGYFAAVGLRVDLRTVEWGAYLAKVQGGQGEHLFLLAGTNRTFDPHFTLARLYANASLFGQYYYGNARIDELAGQAAASLDSQQRRARYAAILAMLRDDVPAIWLAQLNDIYGVSGLAEWAPRADSLLWMYDATTRQA